MPILTSGSNVTLSVAVGQILTVQSDQATFDFENPVGTRVGEYACDTVFGPFVSAGSVKLTSVQGPVFYELGTGQSANTGYVPSNAAITGGTIAGNKLLRINNGTRQLRVIPFGDSITQQNSSFVNNLWQFGSGYAEASLYQAGPRYQLIRNAGISGDTTTAMRARIATDVLAYSPDVVLMCGGRNDIVASITNAQIAAMFTNLEAMVRQMLQAGILPIIVTVPASSLTPAETRKVIPFYYSLAQSYGLPLIDLFRLTVDPATGNYLAGYSGDSTHPNATAIAAISAVVSSTLQNLATAFCPPYMASYSDTAVGNFANLIRNGCFAQAASPPTPDGWTVNTTNATQTLVAATPSASSPYNGNTFNYQKTGTGAVYALFGSSPAVGASFSVGDVLQFSGRVNVSGVTPATAQGFTVGIDINGATGSMRPFVNWPYNGDFVFCETLTVPAGCTSVTPTFFLNGNDLATYKVNNLTLFNVTAANAIWQPNAS